MHSDSGIGAAADSETKARSRKPGRLEAWADDASRGAKEDSASDSSRSGFAKESSGTGLPEVATRKQGALAEEEGEIPVGVLEADSATSSPDPGSELDD